MITKIEKFGATWCGPCKALDKTLQQLKKETDIEIITYDVDENEKLATERGIRNVPVLIFYENEKEVKRTVGALPLNKIKQILSE